MHQFSIDSAGEVLAVLGAAFDAEQAGGSGCGHDRHLFGGTADTRTADAHLEGHPPEGYPAEGHPAEAHAAFRSLAGGLTPVGVVSDRELLGWVVAAKQFTDRLEALTLALIGEAVGDLFQLKCRISRL